MAKETCVFCGNEVGFLHSDFVTCGPTGQCACKACAKEVKNLDNPERCRRALQRGLAKDAHRLQEFLDQTAQHAQECLNIAENAESSRPTCLRCGEKLYFGQIQTLDSSPYRDGLFSSTFDILPAYCKACGKLEFYDPAYISNNQLLSHLVQIDNNGSD